MEYPVAFGPNGLLIGFAAAKDLEANEVYMELPESSVVNRTYVMKTPLGALIKKHPEIFEKHEEDDFALIIWYLYERLKGEKSEWYPCLAITNLSELPFSWKDEEIAEF